MFDSFGRQPLSLLELGLALSHFSTLLDQTWPMAVIGSVGLWLLVRSTGQKVKLVRTVTLLGAVWAAILAFYSYLGVGGVAIVHALGFSSLVLGSFAWIIRTVAGGSRLR